MKTLLILSMSLMMIGCEEEASQSLINAGGGEAPEVAKAVGYGHEVQEESLVEESLDEDADLEVVKKEREQELEFSYDEKSGECLDQDGLNVGSNEEALECADESHNIVSGINFEEEKPYGLDLSGSTILKSQKIRVKDLYLYEVIIDEDTIFEGRGKFVSKLVKNFNKRSENLEKRIEKFEQRIEDRKNKISKIEERLAQGVSEKKEEKLNKRVQSLIERIETLKGKLSRAEVKLNYVDSILEKLN